MRRVQFPMAEAAISWLVGFLVPKNKVVGIIKGNISDFPGPAAASDFLFLGLPREYQQIQAGK